MDCKPCSLAKMTLVALAALALYLLFASGCGSTAGDSTTESKDAKPCAAAKTESCPSACDSKCKKPSCCEDESCGTAEECGSCGAPD